MENRFVSPERYSTIHRLRNELCRRILFPAVANVNCITFEIIAAA